MSHLSACAGSFPACVGLLSRLSILPSRVHAGFVLDTSPLGWGKKKKVQRVWILYCFFKKSNKRKYLAMSKLSNQNIYLFTNLSIQFLLNDKFACTTILYDKLLFILNQTLLCIVYLKSTSLIKRVLKFQTVFKLNLPFTNTLLTLVPFRNSKDTVSQSCSIYMFKYFKRLKKSILIIIINIFCLFSQESKR